MVNYYPCENHFDYTSWACGTACYTLQPVPSTASWIYALLAPLFIICTSNVLLIARVIYQKRRTSFLSSGIAIEDDNGEKSTAR
ncbi:unnamed protein product [Adineta steineri]|uniref:Uncharacterized protein n=1 Tax=Adineta steineri TaxID=433720 RepID=A0A820RGV4_9BILA|nr:unnamed protein product [Adineta steineri]